MAVKNIKKKNKGFVILFAVLVSTIILIITAGIFNFAIKSSILSSYAEESQIAFYAADTGMECALYWDISPEISQTVFDQSYAGDAPTCAGDTITVSDDGSDRYWFWIDLDKTGDTIEHGCVFVLIDKSDTEVIEEETVYFTEITAAGYNSCETDGGTIGTNKGSVSLVERRLNSRYASGVVGS